MWPTRLHFLLLFKCIQGTPWTGKTPWEPLRQANVPGGAVRTRTPSATGLGRAREQAGVSPAAGRPPPPVCAHFLPPYPAESPGEPPPGAKVQGNTRERRSRPPATLRFAASLGGAPSPIGRSRRPSCSLGARFGNCCYKAYLRYSTDDPPFFSPCKRALSPRSPRASLRTRNTHAGLPAKL